jgi:hypothetical protein
MNTLSVMRLLSQLQGNGRPQPALVPLDTGRGRYEDEEPRHRERRRSPPPKKERKKKAPPPESSSEEEGYGSPSSSDYSSYDEPEVIKRRYAEDPCENISPAALSSKKTKKEVVNYLEEKQCPKIEKHAKRKHEPPAPKAVSNPAPPAANPPPAPVAPVPPLAPAAPPAPTGEIAKKKMGRPKKAVDPTKPKKPPTAYNQLVGKLRKEGKTFAEAAKAAKAELDAKKQKPE